MILKGPLLFQRQAAPTLLRAPRGACLYEETTEPETQGLRGSVWTLCWKLKHLTMYGVHHCEEFGGTGRKGLPSRRSDIRNVVPSRSRETMG